jgi:hypothetical protein
MPHDNGEEIHSEMGSVNVIGKMRRRRRIVDGEELQINVI